MSGPGFPDATIAKKNEAKMAKLDAILRSIEDEKQTCRVEIHFKDGVLCSGNKYLPII